MSTKSDAPYAVDRTQWEETAGHVKCKGLCLSIVLFGASGDLAQHKTYPTLASLFSQEGCMPESAHVVGFARSELNDESLRDEVRAQLPGDEASKTAFLGRVKYVHGNYDSPDDFSALSRVLSEAESAHGGAPVGRLFYLALPPEVYGTVLTQIKQCCADVGAHAKSWLRVIVEKPFGRDVASAEQLNNTINELFSEEQIYRIDHYVAKDPVQNMLVMRFSNMFLSAVWNRQHIERVTIQLLEDFGCQGRTGYFEGNGIIRDDIQNHVMQVLTLLAMERPVSMHPDDVRDEKAKLLRSVRKVAMDDVVFGQYTAHDGNPAYVDDPGVPEGSETATYTAMRLWIDNERWAGVPFMLIAGKAVKDKKSEVRIQFKSTPGYFGNNADGMRNEFVMQIEPKEATYMTTVVKQPGLEMKLLMSDLNLDCGVRYDHATLGAYTRVILDAINGFQQHFMRRDEIRAAWAIFDPLLHAMEKGEGPTLHLYPYGSQGPAQAEEFIHGQHTTQHARRLPDGDAPVIQSGYARWPSDHV